MILFILVALHLTPALVVQPPSSQYSEACKGATHFYNIQTMKTPPAWTKNNKPLCTIGAHRFYADPPTPNKVK